MNRQTTLARNETLTRQWWVVDATDQSLGRLAVKLARILLGKHKPLYTPHVDVGDFVVVLHADKIRITGKKPESKFFQRYSGYPDGLRTYSYQWMLENRPELLLERAVRRMMPRNKLRAARLKKLKIYRGDQHPHQAQNPQPLA